MPLCALVLAILPLLQEPPARTPRPATRPAGAGGLPGFVPYKLEIPGTGVTFEMVPIPGGVFTMGSPEGEAGRSDDEGPRHRVRISPFWMGKYEVTWREYELWSLDLDRRRREVERREPTERDRAADAVTRPSKPYVDMSFGMGKENRPAICMTQLAAKTYCEWLSKKTGHHYRLPTEAEWEYACRAGTTTAYSFGDDPKRLGDYAWFEGNSGERYHPVGLKKPNPFGLYDMHGNVAEWVLDGYDRKAYARFAGRTAVDPFVPPKGEYPRVVRGGSWMDPPEMLRSAARRGSDPSWKMLDPQVPQSRWYHTSAPFVGFRIVRPYETPKSQEGGGKPLKPARRSGASGARRAPRPGARGRRRAPRP